MLYPPIGELLSDEIGSRYGLVIVTAKRARMIVDKVPVLTEIQSGNPVTLAVNEIYEGKVTVDDGQPVVAEETNQIAGGETEEANE